ncbi:MAG: ParB/RepB/Spo0J family partition protein [Solobacterium sp.]|nr:ParB/RepB/Spo0J family partition protein [Solobacterium sp.]
MAFLFDIFERDHTGEVIRIPIDKIKASRYQPRIHFDETAMNELTESIKANGLIQPITVREIEDHYEIIAGERRWRACQKAGFESVPCYILSPGENEAAEMAIVENIQRENLTAVEEAKGYVMIMRQANLTQEEVAEIVGKSQSAVANKIRLLNLPQEVQDAVADRQISERHARALLSLPQEKQVAAYHYVADRNLNVRQTEAYIEQISDRSKPKRKQKTKGFTRSTQVGINSVYRCVRMIKKMGIDVIAETEESMTDVRVIVRFPR